MRPEANDDIYSDSLERRPLTSSRRPLGMRKKHPGVVWSGLAVSSARTYSISGFQRNTQDHALLVSVYAMPTPCLYSQLLCMLLTLCLYMIYCTICCDHRVSRPIVPLISLSPRVIRFSVLVRVFLFLHPFMHMFARRRHFFIHPSLA